MESKKDFKSGYVSIIGRPNVGKSTLLNALIGEFISIITPKPQTTRVNILGIKTTPNYQICFYDTPGMLNKVKYELHKTMIEEIKKVIENSDLLILMVEPVPKIGDIEQKLIELIKNSKKEAILAINKIDTVSKNEILPVIDLYSKLNLFKEIIPISASTGDGLDILEQKVVELLPYGEALYDSEDLSDKPMRFFVAEIIREKIFNLYGEEIPYSSAVEVEEWREEQNKVYIRAIIYVEKDSQKSIIIGKGGEKIKKIGTLSRIDIEKKLNKKVFLDLWVKVKENWRSDPNFLKKLGYLS
ncbi:MAG: GTPase Era [Candidatus Hydrothermales bacterium]